jgi:hypothetical protein
MRSFTYYRKRKQKGGRGRKFIVGGYVENKEDGGREDARTRSPTRLARRNIGSSFGGDHRPRVSTNEYDFCHFRAP